MIEYRELQEPDYPTLVEYNNMNSQRESPIWCRSGDWDTERLRRYIEGAAERGKLRTIARIEDGKIASYFAGYSVRDYTIFVAGVVDPTRPDYFDVWREDAARMLDMVIKDGTQKVVFRYSSDQAEIVPWTENELGARRLGDDTAWKITAQELQAYVEKYTR